MVFPNIFLKPTLFKRSSLVLAIALSVSQPVTADSVIANEQKLLSGLESIHSLKMDQALSQFSELGEQTPKYKLAHLIKADLLAAKAGQHRLSQKIHKKYRRSVSNLLDEAQVRWQFANDGTQSAFAFEDFVLKSANQKHIIVVSLQESRLYLYKRNEQGQMTQVVDYYVTMGRKGSGKQIEGDLRTPVGVYHVVDLLPGKGLPDLYGVGALPLNYPNEWDKQNGKTGSGIWLHGVPSDTYIRPPKSSRGCVVLNNNAMETLLSQYDVPFSTPVVIADRLLADFDFVDNRDTILSDVKNWLKANQHQVDWNKVSVYRYPNEKSLYYVTFPGEKSQSLVHQFWKRGLKGAWEVLIESKDPIEVSTKSG